MKTTIGKLHEFYQKYSHHKGKISVLTRFGYKRIIESAITSSNSEVITITTKSQKRVSVSPDHLLLSTNVKWKSAKSLSLIDVLFSTDGIEKICNIRKEKFRLDLYDIQVEGVSEYYANGIVSHNSTLGDAIFLCLFNRPFRDINKGQLVNAINEKNCVVECEFERGGKEFLVRRGIKPNVFEIYKDGVLLNQDAATKDYQQLLEQQILGMNYKSASRMVVLGAASYVPFMQLKAQDRREFIEKLLDIEVFSTMSTTTKTRISELKTKISDAQTDLDIAENKLTTQKKLVDALKSETEEKILAHQSEIQEQDELIDGFQSSLDEKIVEVKELKTSIKDEEDVKTKEVELRKQQSALETQKKLSKELAADNTEKLQKLEAKKRDQETELKNFQTVLNSTKDDIIAYSKYIVDLREAISDKFEVSKELRTVSEQKQKIKAIRDRVSSDVKFYETNETCPECKQQITSEFKALTLTEKQTKLEQCDQAEKKLIEKEETLLARSDRIQQFTNDISEFESKVAVLKNTVKNTESNIAKLEASLSDTNAEIVKLNQPKPERKVLTEEEISKAERKLEKISRELLDRKQKIEDIKKTIQKLEKDIAVVKNSLQNALSYKTKLEKMIGELQSKQSRVAKEEVLISEYTRQVEEQETTLKNLHHQKTLHDLVLGFLKDDGVKASIVKEYLPAINSYTNRFLSAMNFFVTFNIDESFNEVIQSRGRDDFSYMNFSEGEKQRIDIALLFTWRAIAKAKNSINTNLMILDEVLDSHLSTEAAENVIDMLRGDVFKGSNIFVISHKEAIVDKFDNVITFKKEKNFSVIQ